MTQSTKEETTVVKSIDEMTEEELFSALFDQEVGKNLELAETKMAEALQQVKAELEISLELRSDRESILEDFSNRFRQLTTKSVEAFMSRQRASVRQIYTVEDMRIILKFREQHPELTQKMRESGIQLGENVGQWLGEFLGSLQEFLSDFDEELYDRPELEPWDKDTIEEETPPTQPSQSD